MSRNVGDMLSSVLSLGTRLPTFARKASTYFCQLSLGTAAADISFHIFHPAVMCRSRKYPYPPPPPWKVFSFAPCLLPAYFAFKISAFKTPPPPRNFPTTFHGVGRDFFWNCTIPLDPFHCPPPIASCLWSFLNLGWSQKLMQKLEMTDLAWCLEFCHLQYIVANTFMQYQENLAEMVGKLRSYRRSGIFPNI